MSKISNVNAIQVFDSRGIPTIACEISLDNGICASAMVPSGASTGSKEALAVSYTHLTLPTTSAV